MIHLARSEKGPVRTNNEDNYLARVMGDNGIFILADGIGGIEGGEVAASMACEQMMELICSEIADSLDTITFEEFRICMDAFVNSINKSILLKALEDDELFGMGTTLTVLVLRRTEVLICHVGDTRCYLCHGSSITRLTEDHSYRNKLVKSLGVNEYINPSFYRYNIIYGDLILMCTDGLYGTLDDKTIAVCLKRHNDLEDCLNNLFDEAGRTGSTDNLTGIVINTRPGNKRTGD